MTDTPDYDFFQSLFGKEVGSKIAERNLQANTEFEVEYQNLDNNFKPI